MNFITLIFTSLLVLNINSVIASNNIHYNFCEKEYNSCTRYICPLIWNDQLFVTNKSNICKKISKKSKTSLMYMNELIHRMVQDDWFKNFLLMDSNINNTKQILIDYMECMVMDDYYNYYNFHNEPTAIFNNKKQQYKNNLMARLYELGYSINLKIPFEQYAEQCYKLYSDLKYSVKSKTKRNKIRPKSK